MNRFATNNFYANYSVALKLTFFIAADGFKNCQAVEEMEKISGTGGNIVRA
jgi:hypothetical protein